MPAMTNGLLDAAEHVRTVYVQAHAKDAAKVRRKLRAVAGRIAAGQTQLTDYHATLVRQLRVLTAGSLDVDGISSERGMVAR